jgi:hypothetical protein
VFLGNTPLPSLGSKSKPSKKSVEAGSTLSLPPAAADFLLGFSLTLKTEVMCCSETSASLQTTQYYNGCESLKSNFINLD